MFGILFQSLLATQLDKWFLVSPPSALYNSSLSSVLTACIMEPWQQELCHSTICQEIHVITFLDFAMCVYYLTPPPPSPPPHPCVTCSTRNPQSYTNRSECYTSRSQHNSETFSAATAVIWLCIGCKSPLRHYPDRSIGTAYSLG